MDRTNAILTGLAVLLLVLISANILLGLGNQSLRLEVNERQQVLTQSFQLEALHREIVNAIATAAVKTNDAQLKSVLTSQGISLTPEAAQPGSAK